LTVLTNSSKASKIINSNGGPPSLGTTSLGEVGDEKETSHPANPTAQASPGKKEDLKTGSNTSAAEEKSDPKPLNSSLKKDNLIDLDSTEVVHKSKRKLTWKEDEDLQLPENAGENSALRKLKNQRSMKRRPSIFDAEL